MYKGRRIGAIIAAAGSGSRMGGDKPKQFLNVDGIPVIAKTYRAFADCDMIDVIYVVTGEDMMQQCKNHMVPYLDTKQLKKFGGIVSGGNERQDSVYNALIAVKEQGGVDYVLIHDAARPFVTGKIIETTVKAAESRDAAIVCVRPKDTIRTVDETLDRRSLMIVQTPQGFRFDLLMNAYEKAYADGYYGTDDASLVERIGVHPALVEGSYANIKLTTREDLPSVTRIGKGFDVHRLVEERKCIIGGVDIPNKKGLLGHSDADVLTHAIMDALLGAAALGDIGRIFPDSDEQFKNADSIKMLEQVGYMIREKGYGISNIDATVICERPKISPYVEEMIENIAKALKIDSDRINIKGTTTEKLGFTGRKEGIAAEAVCILNTL
ncbi:2-C-methyl-D-erythritol 2,4-cyclodiphosphate synthase [Gallibacter intestinalis]|uniref:Bifunctional enzyme IspD/IspF n=1 Tax=Gallibacter intestinalis TaxID=2779356 RepID=A0ABR9QVF5_9FIRM|nr:2-C-methyl-D-erythritol 2,4-cyclodiphosphate synthase [Gallibacter intestinalis]MBE5034853.1 2-C-methyl-D-erythritol 2,4-cyclodiphosphate synthase [Gallibacter intestinalis]